MSERDEFVKGLRDLAAFLESRPDVPLPGASKDIQVCVLDGDDEAKRAAVQAAAEAMGVTPHWSRGSSTHYEARVCFGPIEYFVLAITAAHMREYAEIDRLGREALKRQRAAAAAAPPGGCCQESERLGGPCAECRHGIEVGDRVSVRAPGKFTAPRTGVVTAVTSADTTCPIEVRLDGSDGRYYYFAPRQVTVTARAGVAW